uniref:MSP domain-containing protein n=1 Tax=Graphocephala atropunctata TaxID=36148 RepID=A0A1B6LLY2_9HEMI
MQGVVSSGDGKVPIFVFPQTITFYLEDPTSHKQTLTLYNPYEFAIRFKVMCTSPKKFNVVDPEGSIKAKCFIDIVIRHSSISLANCQAPDKFRIQMFDFHTKQPLGRRDVTATLVSGEPERSTPDQEFETLPPSPPSTRPLQQYSLCNKPPSSTPNQLLLSAVAAVCIAVLFMPCEGEDSVLSWRVTVNLKLVVSYVLGLVSMVILRPN